MTEVQWEEPPPAGRSTGRPWLHQELAEELKRNPGRWALVGTYSSVGNRQTLWKKKGYECTTRSVDGSFVLYARWPEEETDG